MEVSQVVLEWQAQARAEGREEGRVEGRVEGRAEGRAEGRVEERVQTVKILREQLLSLLRTKAQTELPADLVAVVQAQAESTLLQKWFNIALVASSIEELREAYGLS